MLLALFGILLPLILSIPTNAKDARYKRGEVLVKLRRPGGGQALGRIASQVSATSTRRFGAPRSLPDSRAAHWVVIRLGADITTQKALERLADHPLVEAVEPNYYVQPHALPDDPHFSQQWHLHNTGQLLGDGLAVEVFSGPDVPATPDADIDAAEAWNIHRDAADVVVAVIDTGVEYTHPELAANIWVNRDEVPENGIDDDGNGFVDDVHGYDFFADDPDPIDCEIHGTQIAGIVGAEANNVTGVSGIAWSSEIMAIRAHCGFGLDPVSEFVDSILYAIDNGAQIANHSWGLLSYSQSLRDAFLDAQAAGMLSVVSAGNAATSIDSDPVYPAAFDLPSIISVAATDQDDELWFDSEGFGSNFGLSSVDLGAPGVNILTTVSLENYLPGTPVPIVGGDLSTGTSFAAPMVSGAAALLWSLNPSLTALEVKQRILDTTDPLPSLAGKTVTGGRLNLRRALEPDDPEPRHVPSLATTVRYLIDPGDTACNDEVDNDGDGQIDLADPQCSGPNDDREASGGTTGGSRCGLGFEVALALGALSWLRTRRETRVRSGKATLGGSRNAT